MDTGAAAGQHGAGGVPDRGAGVGAGLCGPCGRDATQNAAVLRLLLAVLFTVFSRVDAKGKPQPLAQSDDALERWSELWQLGHFPAEPVRDYLEQWKDRFWLFHPTHPFWQVPTLAMALRLTEKS